jgi:hypothetical protein
VDTAGALAWRGARVTSRERGPFSKAPVRKALQKRLNATVERLGADYQQARGWRMAMHHAARARDASD